MQHWLSDLPNAAITSRDPLNLDQFLGKLPLLNEVADIRPIRAEVERLIPSLEQASRLSYVDALAAMRDIGMIVGSLQRHESHDPFADLDLQRAMLELGRRTGMVPRDTVLHYCWWNPTGSRMRTFTGDERERRLIQATAIALKDIETAARNLVRLPELNISDPEYAIRCRTAGQSIHEAAQTVHLSRSGLDARHFAVELRPYYEPIQIAGKEYDAPAAAQVPLYLIDQMMWGHGEPEVDLYSLRDGLSRYGLPIWRETFLDSLTRKPLIKQMIQEIEASTPWDNGPAQRSAEGLLLVAQALLTFRGRHIRLVKAAYDSQISRYAAGSSGATPDLLQKLITATREFANSIRQAIPERRTK
ncbi:monodechloroaminopyrrolnitrin synthase PrnB family protein [Streptomyces sp. 3211]|uniref:monodechloroaminopyrrolnitrin synthase PrnB family protein n=1 Tax=Streptomyces sp. 3211 TaxID=1964449 RepID=UPI0009A4EC06|nr:monodechloroaminopyrrolnitrin synthase PrnB family protein [Streptomyces sp. 3211]